MNELNGLNVGLDMSPKFKEQFNTINQSNIKVVDNYWAFVVSNRILVFYYIIE